MHSITNWLQQASGPVVYAVVAALVFGEDALFVGFVLPGETAAVLGGVIASRGRVSVYVMCAVVVAAAIVGDTVGYEIGARAGPRILDTRALQGHRERIAKAQDLIRRRGPAAVFLGRFVAFFRAMMPALAGISRMRYRVFLPFNAAGGLVWGVGFTLLGYFAGAAYKKVERTAGTAAAIVVAVVVVAALVVWHVRRRRGEQAEERRYDEEQSRAERASDGGSNSGSDGGSGDGPDAGSGSGSGGGPGDGDGTAASAGGGADAGGASGTDDGPGPEGGATRAGL